jgi:hypothetical protein
VNVYDSDRYKVVQPVAARNRLHKLVLKEREKLFNALRSVFVSHFNYSQRACFILYYESDLNKGAAPRPTWTFSAMFTCCWFIHGNLFNILYGVGNFGKIWSAYGQHKTYTQS